MRTEFLLPFLASALFAGCGSSGSRGDALDGSAAGGREGGYRGDGGNVAGASGGGPGGASSGGASPGRDAGSGVASPGLEAGSDAAPAEGCLLASVRRAAADTQQPWVKWPTAADGTGTLVVSARRGPALVARVEVPGADLTPLAARYAVSLGCLGPGTYVLQAFLDDNGDAAATDVVSHDYRDSCMGGAVPVAVEVTVTGGRRSEGELVLYQSCDPLMD